MQAVILTVTVTGDPTEDEDADVPGTYEVSVPGEAFARSKADAADLALDAFHGKNAIGMVEDFSITVTGPDGDPLDPNDEWTTIPGVYGTFQGKVP